MKSVSTQSSASDSRLTIIIARSRVSEDHRIYPYHIVYLQAQCDAIGPHSCIPLHFLSPSLFSPCWGSVLRSNSSIIAPTSLCIWSMLHAATTAISKLLRLVLANQCDSGPVAHIPASAYLPQRQFFLHSPRTARGLGGATFGIRGSKTKWTY